MNRILYSFAVIPAILAAVACRKVNVDTEDSSPMVFSARIDLGFLTKTTLAAGNKVCWESGDGISVNGVRFDATPDGADASLATFTKNDSKTDPSGPFTVFYPASMFDGTTAALPATQTYAAGKLNAPMYSYGTSTSLTFSNICAVLAVTVSSSDMTTVRKIRVSSGNHAMSGTFTVDSGKAVLDSPSAVENQVVLDCSTGVDVTMDGSVFFISIPAQTYRNLKIELSADGSSYTKSMTTKKDTDIEVSVNTIYSIAFAQDYIEGGTNFGAPATIAGVKWAPVNCGTNGEHPLGRHYTFADAASACPSGWRLPTRDEFGQLAFSDWSTSDHAGTAIRGSWDGTLLGWNFGNVFMPAAEDSNYDPDFGINYGYYWSSASNPEDEDYGYLLSFSEYGITTSTNDKTTGLSVRCIQD